MRHAEVAYVDGHGRPLRLDDVPLTARGRDQARAAAAVLAGVRLDRVITSGLRRTVETASIVAPGTAAEEWPELREIVPGRLADLPPGGMEEAFHSIFRGDKPLDAAFLGGETLGSLLDRVLPTIDRLLADRSWDTALLVLHGGVNRAILSFALTGARRFLGGLEQAFACINILDVGDDWVVRAVNYAAHDPLHTATRATTMEELYRLHRLPGQADR